MKITTTTLLLIAVAAYMYSQSQKSTAAPAPQVPSQPSTGGDSTWRDVMELIRTGGTIAKDILDYANDRNSSRSGGSGISEV